MTDWQAIETAPKETDVLVYEKDHPFGPIMFGFQLRDGKWVVPELQCGGQDEAKPTHWMLLPEPPKKDQNGE